MSTQQGTFLMPVTMNDSFNANLFKTLGVNSTAFDQHRPIRFSADSYLEVLDRAVLMKIIIPRELHAEGMLDLAAMNVTSTSLFGGLEGFARSLPGILRMSDERYYRKLRHQELLSGLQRQ
jgi:hypothetical protein